MRIVGRIIADDGSVRDLEVEADEHGTAKIRLKNEVRPSERLVFIRVVEV